MNKVVESEAEKEELLNLIKPYTEQELTAHTVGTIRGKRAIGNKEIATRPAHYPELEPDTQCKLV